MQSNTVIKSLKVQCAEMFAKKDSNSYHLFDNMKCFVS